MSLVAVEQYNPEWPLHFQKIKAELESYLDGVSLVSIEHVGSTAVPGLAAKAVIDVDIIVRRENLPVAIDALVARGNFTYRGERGIVDRHAFTDPNQSPPRNIYVCVEGAFQLRNHIGIRDTLRSNADLRDEYGVVKLGLAARGMNIVDYVEAKGEIIQKILKAAGLLSHAELDAIEQANLQGEIFGTVIKTERLLLREFVPQDEEAFYQLESKEEVVKYQTWPPRTRQQAREEVAKIIQNSSVKPRKHIEFAIEHGGKFIGRVGAHIKRKNEDGDLIDPPHTDLWFSFLPEYQGKGFATEAMKAFVVSLKSPKELEIECDPRNSGSWKLAERLGFERVGLFEKHFECKGEWVDSLVYRKLT